MIYCRFESDGIVGWGIVEQHEVWEVAPDIFSEFERTGRTFPIDAVRFLPPTVPSKIIAVGLNYADHAREFGQREVPKEPLLFLKAPSAVIGLDEPIRLPRDAGPVDYEAELGVVIARKVHRISEAEALDAVLGLTCVNDVTARALQKQDGQWARAKSFDTFCPVGPWIADDLPPQNLRVGAYLNQRPVQLGHSSQMLFPVAKLVSFISQVMTLYPGDLISTGTPLGVGPLKPGDTIEIFVEGVGKLRNSVVGEPVQ